jgi:N-acetylglucosaminyldiphosphoundecaprenol N-acetyl-beta-D-mannosaminyltransferase
MPGNGVVVLRRATDAVDQSEQDRRDLASPGNGLAERVHVSRRIGLDGGEQPIEESDGVAETASPHDLRVASRIVLGYQVPSVPECCSSPAALPISQPGLARTSPSHDSDAVRAIALSDIRGSGRTMRAELFGVPVDALSFDETVQCAITAMETRTCCQHVALNVAKLVNSRHDPELDQDIRQSDIVSIDGMGILFALRLLGVRVPHRVTGIDLFQRLLAECAKRGLRPYLLGATPEVLSDAMAVLKRRYPDLQLAGFHHGYFSLEQEEGICRKIAASNADCLFIAMPTPRKERFMHRFRDRLGVPFLMGVGGSIDVVAGHVQRAPSIVQRVGLEWFYRLAQEPRRLGWRYLWTNTVFLGMLLRYATSRLTHTLHKPTPGSKVR